jgi:hypothetical protein
MAASSPPHILEDKDLTIWTDSDLEDKPILPPAYFPCPECLETIPIERSVNREHMEPVHKILDWETNRLFYGQPRMKEGFRKYRIRMFKENEEWLAKKRKRKLGMKNKK